MNDELRQRVIQALQRGEDLPNEWARELFPPEKREYELVYHGKEREEDIIAGTMAVPLQAERAFGKNGVEWHNMLIFGDNLQVMKTLLEQKQAGKLCNADGTPGIRLIYIDPPFATKREFSGSQDQKAYQDKIAGAQFVEYLRRRLVIARELLAEDGSIYVHLDWKKGHYIKLVLDEIFGENNFRNEIIWHYHDKFATGGKSLDRNHDTIFHYSKSSAFIGNEIRIAKEEATRRALRKKVDGKTINILDEEGNKIYGEFTDKRVDDVWDIGRTISSNEYLGYPTQKKEALIDRILRYGTNDSDLVMDFFCGSGTTLAVAEKLRRRWIGIDCGKLAIYTVQKRMLNLKAEIGNKGKVLKLQPFTLYNAGLYDFSKLKQLPWVDWRFFCLQLFGCKDEPHTVGGLQLDGKLKGASVLVFNHQEQPGAGIDEETVRSIHAAIGKKIGRKFYIIAPRGVFGFQQDYIDLDGVRYYAMRVPYSIINELHQREFTALKQPDDETAVNDTVDSVGFDFIQPPKVKWTVGVNARKGQLVKEAFLKIEKFESRARLRGEDTHGGLETFSLLMLDFDYNGDVFDLDAVFYNHQMEESGWEARFPAESLGDKVMAVFIDTHGNEAREVIPLTQFGLQPTKPVAKEIKAKAKPKTKPKK